MKTKESFIARVTSQITSKEAKQLVTSELQNHLKQSERAWSERGYSATEAETKAVESMGSAEVLGIEMNRMHRLKVDWLMMGLLVALLGLSVLYEFLQMTAGSHAFLRQILFVSCAGMILVGMMLFDYRKLKRWGLVLYGAVNALLLYSVFFPSHYVNGKPVVMLGFFQSDSRVLVPLLILACVCLIQDQRYQLWQLVILFAGSLFLLGKSHEVMELLYFSGSIVASLLYSRFSTVKVLILSGISAIVGGSMFYVISSSCLKARLLDMVQFTPSFESLQLQRLLAHTSWFGEATDSVENYELVNRDFVLAAIASHFGWVCVLFVIALFIAIAVRFLRLLPVLHDSFGKQLMLGIAIYYSLPIVLQFGMTFGVLPVASVELPFVGNGVLTTAILLGIALSVYRRKDRHQKFVEKV
ncbi:cell division protein ftsW [Fictibacillus macauensis ZFHKF-1]|uniref:Cell division protein ftsW n=1 Tax=Fictibacillus macauensis ZFHKF-1 TaxID=1196324 RepID=I8IY27_9BACL|nr:FtsW/RodA/SpoVE family cell cycle protein [Fictibacillus macauensis]EIT84391.1 cell division protein ftsW [Fictibacillus macauensis ZFHKF-1]